MGKYVINTIENYLSDAASNKPAPGGGSVSALAGALGCAMGEMAANFTVGKKKFAEVEVEVRESLARLQRAREELTVLIDEDVRAYLEVTRAQALPRDSAEEKDQRSARLQEALRNALLVPLNIMRQCALICNESKVLVSKANPYLITDVGVCAIMAEAACRAARLNVEVNLLYMKDAQYEAEVRKEADALCEAAVCGRERVDEGVGKALGP